MVNSKRFFVILGVMFLHVKPVNAFDGAKWFLNKLTTGWSRPEKKQKKGTGEEQKEEKKKNASKKVEKKTCIVPAPDSSEVLTEKSYIQRIVELVQGEDYKKIDDIDGILAGRQWQDKNFYNEINPLVNTLIHACSKPEKISHVLFLLEKMNKDIPGVLFGEAKTEIKTDEIPICLVSSFDTRMADELTTLKIHLSSTRQENISLFQYYPSKITRQCSFYAIKQGNFEFFSKLLDVLERQAKKMAIDCSDFMHEAAILAMHHKRTGILSLLTDKFYAAGKASISLDNKYTIFDENGDKKSITIGSESVDLDFETVQREYIENLKKEYAHLQKSCTGQSILSNGDIHERVKQMAELYRHLAMIRAKERVEKEKTRTRENKKLLEQGKPLPPVPCLLFPECTVCKYPYTMRICTNSSCGNINFCNNCYTSRQDAMKEKLLQTCDTCSGLKHVDLSFSYAINNAAYRDLSIKEGLQ